MTRVNNLNYTVAGENFQRGTVTTDQFQTGDVELLALAVENHQHQNTRGLPVMRVNNGSFAGRPAAGNAGHVYVSTDQNRFSFDNGTAWQDAVVQGVATVGSIIVGAGLQVSTGGTQPGIAVGTTPNTSNGVLIGGSYASASQFGVNSQLTGSSAATTEISSFIGVPATAAAAFTCTTVSSFHAANPAKGAGSTITSAYGLLVDAINVGGTNNYGVYVNAPSGGASANLGLILAGTGNNAQIEGFLKVLGGTASAVQAQSGSIRLVTGQSIGFRNNANTADITLGFDANDAFTITNPAIAAGGSGGGLTGNTGAGGATGAPVSLQVNHWLTFNRNGTLFHIPVFA